MLFDDIIYATLLLVSVAFGYHIQKVRAPDIKQFQSTVVGLFLCIVVSGTHIIHPIFTTAVNAGIVLFCNKRYCHVVSFAFCFTYLAFFRTLHLIGFEGPPTHTNAIQMILTLKMVGLAFEAHESWKLSKDKTKIHRILKLSLLDIFNYSFCYAGVLIGPYYKYTTYVDMLHAPYQPHLQIPCLRFLRQRIKVVPIYVGIFILSQILFPLEYATSEEIMECSLWYRIFYMTPIFINFRMRIYTGFILGECVCIMAGLGIYPEVSKPESGAGPTDLLALKEFESQPNRWATEAYSFQTVHNIEENGSEFKPMIRDGIRSWNKTVQFWLAVFVYKQLPFTKNVRLIVVMLISSFWHGVHPGYYLCLMSAPFFLMAEVQIEKAFRRDSGVLRIIFDSIWWVFKMQAFAYMGMAFILLRIDVTLYYWKSIYFIGHLVLIAFYLLGTVVIKIKPKPIKVD